ncbi:MAG TPA: ABC transporter permease [Marmoricola sp.]|nr:ABC transporter permease [Marmoricola sp.]
MSVPTSSPALAPIATAQVLKRQKIRNYTLIALAGFALLSLVRLLTGAGELTSSGTIQAALTSTIPIAMAGLGGLWSERAGVVNIGLEGMMILGTFGAGYFGYHYGSLAGILGAIILGMVGGLLHAIATVYFGVDHIVSGVAINIIALGAAGFLAETYFTGLAGGGPTQSPPLPTPWTINIPFLDDPLARLEGQDWFLVSDAAGLLRVLVNDLPVLTIVCLGLFVLTFWVLWKTRFGLRLRSCGESPEAAESLGINVYNYKLVAVVISGGLAGLGGAFLAMVASSGFQVGQTGGRGYIGLAAMIFGNWRPTGLLLGSGLFGYTQALPLRREATLSIHALLLLIAILLIAVAVYQLTRRNQLQAIGAAAFGASFLVWYLSTDLVPADFTKMAPYVTTLLVLALASQRLRMPKADGQIYRRGSAG